jgi:hypothetical protein
MINGFSKFLLEEEKTVYFTFGRMNPPTIGHEMLLDKLAKAAGRNSYRVYLSKSNDPKKNPLSYNDKIKFARKMYPRHARNIIKDNKITTVMDIAARLYKDGYVNIVMAVDGPRSREFDILLNKYNGKEARHGFYNFKSIKFINVGERNASSEGIDGVSATKQRNAAKDNDFTAFAQGLPKNASNSDSKALFNAVRKGMGLKEAKEFKNHVQLEPVSDLREAYLRDNIFEKGEQVVMTKNGIVGNIKHLGTNYLIVESKGETWRCWLDDVSKVDPNFKPTWDVQDIPNDDNDGVVRESLNEDLSDDALSIIAGLREAQKWKRGGPDGEVHTTHKGQTWRVRKNYDHNDRHTGEYRIEVKKKNPYGGHDWEWHDTVHGKEHAKSRLPESNQPEWGKPESTKKAKLMTPGEATTPQDKEIAGRKGTQPARYHKGLSRATKVARDRQFKKQAKMSDRDPAAYKPAPGDKTAKTKPSRYTKFVDKLMGEHNYSSKEERIKAHKRLKKQHTASGNTRLAKMYDTKIKRDQQ